MKEKITLRFIFAAIQSLIAFSAIILAALLNFRLLGMQTMLNINPEALNFYIVILLVFGFVFLIGGLFLLYEWWETR